MNKKDPKIVLIGGEIASGKNTVSNFFIKKGFECYSFANPMKNFFAECFGITREEAEEKSKRIPELGWTLRQLYQFFGTELIRNQIDKDFWVISMKKRIERNKPGNLVIPDLRFPNENLILKKELPQYNIYSIRIIRPNSEVNSDYKGFSEHTSELSLDSINFDFNVENSSSIDELENRISEVYKNME